MRCCSFLGNAMLFMHHTVSCAYAQLGTNKSPVCILDLHTSKLTSFQNHQLTHIGFGAKHFNEYI